MSKPAYTEDRPTCVFDTECYQNYWSIGFHDVATDKQVIIETWPGRPLDTARIAKIIRNWRIVGFNSENYDLGMIALAMTGAECSVLKQASDRIIVGGMRPWEFRDHYAVNTPAWIDHIDLMQVSPGAAGQDGNTEFVSLKVYGGRLHSKRIQELPIEPDEWITEEGRETLRRYLGNDLFTTKDKYIELKTQIALRALMSVEYGVDLRSKSDAQMAEAVIKSQLERRWGRRVQKPEIEAKTFQFKAPSFIRFKTPYMQSVLQNVLDARFVVGRNGVVFMPDALKDFDVRIGKSIYRMGLGGLHSSESKTYHESDDEFTLKDSDVASYYPYLILGSGLSPRQLGTDFLVVYKQIVERRIALKKAGRKDEAETLKIVVNGTFGKLGNPYSIMYSPDLMVQVTVSGQLSILMLIEAMELAGIEVVSANTDGFVSKVPKHLEDLFFAIRFDWEVATGLVTEEKAYKALYSRDVNNYIAVPFKGDTKLKGAYTKAGPGLPGASGMKKNPTGEICVTAVVAYLEKGTPIEETIEWCTDIRQFVVVRKVQGGAEKYGEYIGKAVRWYYAKNYPGPMTYRTSGNNVPRSEGAKPCMELPDEFPNDVDHDWYIREAYGILEDIGLGRNDPSLRGRSGFTFARMSDTKNIHRLNLATGVALCGASPKSLRDPWIEYRSPPTGHRLCSKCQKADQL